ncbi:2-isopropylmalate synthase, partial [Patescibacteria group bacterium]|nr:2-isopropylmalate synthase [Patescibacteria group bacterium]
MEKIYIFDTTLRDGEQTPGASLNVNEKLKIAYQLEKLKVDVIEAGFPASSLGDFEAVKTVSEQIKGPVIAALARTLPYDIKKAGEAVKGARRGRIHTFIATSPIHMRYKLKKSPDEVIKLAVEAVKMAKGYALEVEFSPEDASRSNTSFLYEVIEAVIKAGAKIVNIPDTVGYSNPQEFKALIEGIVQNVPSIGKILLSVHCHDDLGMATANSLSALMGGARQIECTINGIGERAGNASLEEVAMALKTREDFFHFYTNINTQEIYQVSRLVSYLTGIPVQPNKAVVGKNAFR